MKFWLLAVLGLAVLLILIREFNKWTHFNRWLKSEFDKLREKK